MVYLLGASVEVLKGIDKVEAQIKTTHLGGRK